MKRKTLKEFNNELSWATRIYTLLAVAVIGFAYLTNASGNNWVMTILLAISAILFVETFAISFHRHPKIWKTIRWILIMILTSLVLIGLTYGKLY